MKKLFNKIFNKRIDNPLEDFTLGNGPIKGCIENDSPLSMDHKSSHLHTLQYLQSERTKWDKLYKIHESFLEEKGIELPEELKSEIKKITGWSDVYIRESKKSGEPRNFWI